MKVTLSVSHLSQMLLLAVFGVALSVRAESVTWQILPFPANSDWPSYRGQPSVTNGNQVTFYGRPVRTAEVFTPPVTFSYDVFLQSRNPIDSDGAFWVFVIPPGEATNLNLTAYVVVQMAYRFYAPNGLDIVQYPPSTPLIPEIPFNVTTGTTYHVTLAIAANGQVTWSINGHTYVDGGATVPYNHFQVQIQGWQPRAVWLMNDFSVIQNQPPVAKCKDGVVSADANCVASASVDDGSFDPDDGDTITLSQSPPGPYPLGDSSVTLTVTDSHGATDSCPATVTVVDDTAPSISEVAVDTPILWPPNHKLVDVTVNYQVTDNCDPVPACTISVTSNEPTNGTGNGNTSSDWVVVDAHHVRLRAERAGTGSGRIYTLTITCVDHSGNISVETVDVTVPKNAR